MITLMTPACEDATGCQISISVFVLRILFTVQEPGGKLRNAAGGTDGSHF